MVTWLDGYGKEAQGLDIGELKRGLSYMRRILYV